MFDLLAISTIATAFAVAGAVKGVIGFGLPTLSLGILTAVLDLHTAMALLIVPSLVTNVWQAITGGNGRAIWRRLWLFLSLAAGCVWVGATALLRLNPSLLSALLGGLLILYATLSLTGTRLAISVQREVWAGPLCGALNGILAGMTGSFVVPGVMYLQALGLSREMLIQAMGTLFTVSTAALALALQGQGLLTGQLGAISSIGVIPAVVGMLAGQHIRRKLSERRFRQVFFLAVLALGAYIGIQAAINLIR